MNKLQKRSIATCLILCLVTCGIYSIFWLYGIINDICDLKGEERTGGKDILLMFLTCGLYGIYLMYKIGSSVDDLRYARGLSSGSNGILYLILNLMGLGIIVYALAQHSINELC